MFASVAAGMHACVHACIYIYFIYARLVSVVNCHAVCLIIEYFLFTKKHCMNYIMSAFVISSIDHIMIRYYCEIV